MGALFDAHCDQILSHFWLHFNFDITTTNYLTIYRPKTVIEAPPLANEIFHQLIRNFDASKANDSPAESLACEGLAKYLLSFFLPDTSSITTPEAARFIPVLQYIDKNFHAHIANSDLSAIMYLSPTYFGRIFKEGTGESFTAYLTRVRIQRSKELLCYENFRLTDIAQLVGFEDQSYFSRVFKRMEGVSPRRYRELNSKKGTEKNSSNML